MTPGRESHDRIEHDPTSRGGTSWMSAAAGVALPWLMLLWFLLVIVVAVSAVTGGLAVTAIAGVLTGLLSIVILRLVRRFANATERARRQRSSAPTPRPGGDVLTQLARASGIPAAPMHRRGRDGKPER
jgi:hypothetical protein